MPGVVLAAGLKSFLCGPSTPRSSLDSADVYEQVNNPGRKRRVRRYSFALLSMAARRLPQRLQNRVVRHLRNQADGGSIENLD